MKSQNRMLKVLSIVAAVVICVFFVSEIYNLAGRTYNTETTYEETVLETIDAEMYVIRDETMLITGSGGVSVPLANNGERVSKDSAVAAMFSSEASAENYVEKETLKKKLDSYVKIDSQLRLANIDIGKLTDEIDNEFFSMIDGAYKNDFSNLSEYKLSFGEKLSRKQISLDMNIDCTDKIAVLQSQISSLEGSSVPTQIITAQASGYYVSSADGYENIITTSDLDSLTVERIENAVNSRNTEQINGFIGKVISGYNWYFAAIVDSNTAMEIADKSSVKIIFDDTKDAVKAYCQSIISDKDQKSIVVLKCNLMNESLTSLRHFNGKIVVNEYTGLKVKRDAIRVDADGNQGVYIKRANIINFRSINIIYSDESFVIARSPAENSDIKLPYTHLMLYDEVVISGKELSDGMVVG